MKGHSTMGNGWHRCWKVAYTPLLDETYDNSKCKDTTGNRVPQDSLDRYNTLALQNKLLVQKINNEQAENEDHRLSTEGELLEDTTTFEPIKSYTNNLYGPGISFYPGPGQSPETETKPRRIRWAPRNYQVKSCFPQIQQSHHVHRGNNQPYRPPYLNHQQPIYHNGNGPNNMMRTSWNKRVGNAQQYNRGAPSRTQYEDGLW